MGGGTVGAAIDEDEQALGWPAAEEGLVLTRPCELVEVVSRGAGHLDARTSNELLLDLEAGGGETAGLQAW